MDKVFVVKNGKDYVCINSDNDEMSQILIGQGGRELTREEIERYGMAGYESAVSPFNTVVHEDGTITFTPPDPGEKQGILFGFLRQAREEKLAEYDKESAKLGRALRATQDEVRKQILTNKIVEWDAYAQALCDITAQDGAPWDGGAEKTPWPQKPSAL